MFLNQIKIFKELKLCNDLYNAWQVNKDSKQFYDILNNINNKASYNFMSKDGSHFDSTKID